MYQHFTNGHLDKSVYTQTNKIEYVELVNESDQHVLEIYLINYYKPKYNKMDKKSDGLTLNLDIKLNWIEFEQREVYSDTNDNISLYDLEYGDLVFIGKQNSKLNELERWRVTDIYGSHALVHDINPYDQGNILGVYGPVEIETAYDIIYSNNLITMTVEQYCNTQHIQYTNKLLNKY